MTYFFILGNNPTLSIAEIINILSKKILRVKKVSSEVLLIKLSEEIAVLELQNQLGGTIKIGKIISRVNLNSFPDLFNSVWQGLPKNVSSLCFGFSVYFLGEEKININKKIKDIALEAKKKIKEKGISCRWVESNKRVLSSVIIQKNKLLTRGAEINFFIDNNECYMGKTLSCQSFKDYSLRDFGRPARTIKKGMIPPKLGQIMLNLSRKSDFPFKKTLVLDPFCGSGTILQEALLMGYKSIIGTDKDKKTIINAQKNLEWLAKKRECSLKGVKIFYSDVRKLAQRIRKNSVGAIVTEPYLGPLKISSPEYKFVVRELKQLYLLAFEQFNYLLKEGGKIVIIFPIFKIKNKQHFLPILGQLKNQGWETKEPIPLFLLKSPVIRMTKRKSIIYSRESQKVLREILIFRKIS